MSESSPLPTTGSNKNDNDDDYQTMKSGDDQIQQQQQQQPRSSSLTGDHPPPPRLPWTQLSILAFCRLAEPIALSSVYPYLPEMMESFDVPEDQVSKWAGITSAIFSLSQALTGVVWGRASDVLGRKPAILAAMFAIMVSSILFGFSRNLTWAVVTRGLSGASNGNIGLMRTAVAEFVPEKELQPMAFSIMPLVWQVGCALGPVVGGLLANPVARYPEVFKGSKLLTTYPFALPNLVAGVFFTFGLLAGFLFLHETLESKKGNRDVGRALGNVLLSPFTRRQSHHKHALDDEQSAPLLRSQSRNSKSSTLTSPADQSLAQHGEDEARTAHSKSEPSPSSKPKSPSWAEIITRQSKLNLLAYTLLALHSIAYDQLLPVYMHYPRFHNEAASAGLPIGQKPDPNAPVSRSVPRAFSFVGGLSLRTNDIGLFFTGYAVFGMVIQVLIFPRLTLYKGPLWNLKFISLMFPVLYILTPFTTTLVPGTTSAQQTGQLVFLVAVMMGKSYASIFAFPCCIILLTNSASSVRILGTLNGIAVSVSALGRAAGPFLAGWTFTVGVQHSIGVLPWWFLALCAAAAAVPVWWLEEGKSFAERERDTKGRSDGEVK